jgi:hypothetical protein
MRDNVARGTLKRWMFGKRHQVKLEGITGVRNQGSRQHLRLRKGKTTGSGIKRMKQEIGATSGKQVDII